MAQYIDKDDLVTEIKKRINFNERLNAYPRLNECNEILSFIDSLEVKEVDLNKEIREYLSTYWPEEKELHPFLGHIAKHFFELGMQVSNKAQKGEEV